MKRMKLSDKGSCERKRLREEETTSQAGNKETNNLKSGRELAILMK
jgi:hypothetical protein